MKLNPEVSEICGIHAGDGYLRNDGRRIEWDISGNIEEKEYYDKNVIPLFNRVFNLKIKGRFFPSRNTYGFVIRDRSTIEYAHEELGFPYGNKSLKVKVPDFIFSSLALLKAFLRGYFDTDGHFGCAKKYGNYCESKKKFHCYPRLMFTTVSPHLSNSLKEIFAILRLKYSFCNYEPRRKTESLKYRYEINGEKSVKFVMELIESKNPIKTSRYFIWKKFGFCPTNLAYNQRKAILNGNLNPYMFYKGL